MNIFNQHVLFASSVVKLLISAVEVNLNLSQLGQNMNFRAIIL